MMKLNTELKRLHDGLYSLRNTVLREVEHCPPGTLQSYLDRGRRQYVQVIMNNGKRERHGLNRNQDLIRTLARKKYLESNLHVIEKNLVVTDAAVRSCDALDPEEILDSLRQSLPGLPDEYFLKPLAEVNSPSGDRWLDERLKKYRKWAGENYVRSNYKPHQCRITTSRGLKVRSKSEALIANSLDNLGVPFRYEQLVYIGGVQIAPDFTIMAADGEIYWEHAGMLDDPQYSLRHHLKMMQYESAGFYPWSNLVVTYDTGNELNLKMIESIIRLMIMPSL